MTKTKLSVWDFDSTLIDTPTGTSEDKQKWADKYGKPWPYLGWWGRDESLDTEVWDMNPVPEVFSDYQKESKKPNVINVLLTGRLLKQSDLVKKITGAAGYKFDHYLFNNKGSTLQNKIYHLNDLLKAYPDVREVEMWDDRAEHFQHFEDWGELQKHLGRIDSFHLNKVA